MKMGLWELRLPGVRNLNGKSNLYKAFHISLNGKFWSEVLYNYLLLSISPNIKAKLLRK